MTSDWLVIQWEYDKMEINEKKLTTILQGQREEYQRYLGVVAENFETQITLVAESTIEIQRQLTLIKDMVAGNTEDITKNTEDIDMIKTDLHVVRNDIKGKADRSELVAIEKRTAFLEKKFQKA